MSDSSHRKLPRTFYERPTLTVARELLGKHIVFNHPEGKLTARIVEVEAYIGENDPACHAARGLTKRNAVMFGPGGYSYVYFVYGMYNCLNFVTEKESKPAAILLRAAEPVSGIELMKQNSPGKNESNLLSGPGCFCRSFGLTRAHSGLDLTGGTLYLEGSDNKVKSVKRSERIGIKVGTDRLWRFYDKESKSVSGPRLMRV